MQSKNLAGYRTGAKQVWEEDLFFCQMTEHFALQNCWGAFHI